MPFLTKKKKKNEGPNKEIPFITFVIDAIKHNFIVGNAIQLIHMLEMH